MQNMIKLWFKYFIFVGIFGMCINLMYLAVPIYFMVVYDKVLFSFSLATLYTLAVGGGISLVAMGVMDYFRQRMLVQAGNGMARTILPFVLKSLPGYARGLNDLELLRNAVVRGQIFYLLDLPWMLVYLIILYIIQPLISAVALAGLLMTASFQFLLKVLEKKRYILADVAFDVNVKFIQTVLRFSDVMIGMGMKPAVLDSYRKKDEKVMKFRSQAEVFQSGIGAVLRTFHVLCPALVFGVGVFVFFKEELTIGGIFACVIITIRLFHPMGKSLSDMKISIEAMAAYTRLKEFVHTENQIEKLSLPEPEGKVSAETISLALNGKNILHNISFDLSPGQTLGVLGPSGAGKTTFCKTILGILKPTVGKVRLDGAEMIQWPEDELGRYMGYLPQEIELFPGTVAENISRMSPVESEKVVKAAQLAGVHEMILKLPNGYDTKLDLTVKNLSAGQRQLISLARTLYGEPKVVILDEPHTHMDDIGLKMQLTALNNLKQNQTTVIIVTDKPYVLLNMDKILVIKEGQTAMYGPGKEVLQQISGSQKPKQASGV